MGGIVVSAKHDAERLLADLLAAGAIPVLEAGRLRIDAPAGALTGERREELRDCLPELRAIIETRYRSREECVARRPCRTMSICRQPEPDGWPCRLPRVCAICKVALPFERRYLCETCAATSTRFNEREAE
jgi:hypothetical protein